MKCASCSYDNAPDSKFCENCGSPLERACPNCGQAVAPNAKFCRNCGYNFATPPNRLTDLQQAAPAALQQKILTTRKQIEGERKLVTVLFTDIVGSTALAEKLDPEEWGEIVSGAHQRVSDAIYRYEGTIAQLLGDGVLAFFGAPIAHEDDAVRAVNAALDIQAFIGEYQNELRVNKRIEKFQMRVGLNTGLVVVGNVGSDLHMEYLAIGDTVNLASRMQSAAEPGTVLMTANTMRAVKHAIDLETRGAIEVKGKSEPVDVFRALGRKATPESARGIVGLDSPIVGRDREMKTLQTCIDELAQGRGQIVSIMGDAGLGKSRLAAELRKQYTVISFQYPDVNLKSETLAPHASAGVSNLKWLEGRSLSYEISTPYAPFVDLFNRLYHITDSATDAEKYSLIRDNIKTLAENHLEIAPFIATMLGIQLQGDDHEAMRYLEPPQLRGKIFQAVFHFFEHLARQQPLILQFEDLHWADSVSLDLLDQLMRLPSQSPVMILALFRPQKNEPSWRFHETALRDHAHRYTPIALEPLDEASSRQLVANLLEIEDLPEQVRLLILKKAEGNPFFVEEVIRSLLDAKLVVRQDHHWRATREIANINVPDTLVGVIEARLDRLDDESKHTAQTAAVIGREFQFDILKEIADTKPHLGDALETLERRELIREKVRLPAASYLFKHALTQETAYSSLLLSKRRELHKRVAECLERLEPERVNDIARNFLDAQEEARGLPYLVQAGENAARAYSTPEAVNFFTRALEIVQKVTYPEMARRAYIGLGNALMMAYDVPRAIAHFHAMIEYAKANEDIPLQVSALNKLGEIEGQWMGQFDQAETHLVQAERLAREFEHQPGLAELYTVRCGICTMQGDFSNAARYLTESAEIGRALNIKEQEAFGLAHTANVLVEMVQFEQAYAKALESLKLAQEIGNQVFIADAKFFPIAYYHLHHGDLERADQSAAEGAQIAHRIGRSFEEGWGDYVLAEIKRMKGEYEQAIAMYQGAKQGGDAAGMPFFHACASAAMGAVYFEISPALIDRTLELHTFALGQLENPMAAAGSASAFADLGFCALAIGNLDKATELFQNGLTRPTIMALLERPRFFIGQALIALKQNCLDDTRQHMQEARAYVDDHAMKYLMPFVEFVEAQVASGCGEDERALQNYLRAESLASEMTMRPLLWQARAGAASILAKLGRESQAQQKRAAAKITIDEIAAMFKDEKLKTLFVENSMRQMTSDE
ncbi:MAG: AAA family ATPase [Chloroflexi bacterium]|nr:AAA family ATPase [Chloroflexota bacterium]